MVIARTTEGDVGILPNHAPMLSLMVDGIVDVTTADGETWIAAVDAGFLSVANNRISILAEHAEMSHDIDLEKARADLERAHAGGGERRRGRRPRSAGRGPRLASAPPRRHPDPSGSPGRARREEEGDRCRGGSGWPTSPASCCSSSSLYGHRPGRPPSLDLASRRHLRVLSPRPVRQGRARLGSRASAATPAATSSGSGSSRPNPRAKLTFRRVRAGLRRPPRPRRRGGLLALLRARHRHLPHPTGPLEVAMSPEALTGFLAWLEAAPPGQRPRRA